MFWMEATYIHENHKSGVCYALNQISGFQMRVSRSNSQRENISDPHEKT